MLGALAHYRRQQLHCGVAPANLVNDNMGAISESRAVSVLHLAERRLPGRVADGQGYESKTMSSDLEHPAYRTHRIAIALAACVWLMSCSRDPNEEANKLFVEAQQLIASSEGKAATERLRALRSANGNLKAIVEKFPSSQLAVQLVSGQSVGKISLKYVSDATADATWSACLEAPAGACDVHQALDELAKRVALTASRLMGNASNAEAEAETFKLQRKEWFRQLRQNTQKSGHRFERRGAEYYEGYAWSCGAKAFESVIAANQRGDTKALIETQTWMERLTGSRAADLGAIMTACLIESADRNGR